MAKSYVISDGYKGKIDDVILRVGNQPEGSVQRIQTRFESMPGDGGKVFRICTFSGQWNTGSLKTVYFKYVPTEPNTASVMNLVVNLHPVGSCDISIAKDGTAWFLVQPNLTQQPNYVPGSTSGTQILGHIGGTLQWIDTGPCG